MVIQHKDNIVGKKILSGVSDDLFIECSLKNIAVKGKLLKTCIDGSLF